MWSFWPLFCLIWYNLLWYLLMQPNLWEFWIQSEYASNIENAAKKNMQKSEKLMTTDKQSTCRQIWRRNDVVIIVGSIEASQMRGRIRGQSWWTQFASLPQPEPLCLQLWYDCKDAKNSQSVLQSNPSKCLSWPEYVRTWVVWVAFKNPSWQKIRISHYLSNLINA